MESYNRTIRILIIVILVIGAIGLPISINLAVKRENERYVATHNQTYFKNFTLYGLDGEKLSSDDLKTNKVTVINGWAPWCGPCTGEMPNLEILNNEYKDANIKMVGVVADYYEQTNGRHPESYNNSIRQVIKSTGVTYPIFVSDEQFYKALGVTITGYPTTWAVDSNGELIEVVVGAKPIDEWRAYFDKWLGDAE